MKLENFQIQPDNKQWGDKQQGSYSYGRTHSHFYAEIIGGWNNPIISKFPVWMIATTAPDRQKSVSKSLVGLIHSDFFRDFYLVTYLHSNIHSEEIVRELLLKFSTYSYKNQLEFIPFLAFIAHRFKSQRIKDWVCAQCQLDDIRLYLVIRWAFVSVLEDPSNETFINLLDSSAVNGKLMCKLDEMSKDEIQQVVTKKFQRSNYIPILVELYHKLTKICLKLKASPNNERNVKLKEYLQCSMKSFHQKLHKNCPNALYGFTFPHQDQSNYVVNINYDECFCFSTKERVPYKIVFQTINYDELLNYQQKEQKVSSSTGDLSEKSSSSQSEQRNDLMDLVTQQRNIADKMTRYLQQKKRNEMSVTQINETTKLGGYTYQQDWQQMVQRVKQSSKFSNFKSLEVRAYVVKSGDDLRQQAFAIQLIKIVKSIFTEFNLKLWVKTYDVIMTSATSGFIEFIPNTITISSLKRSKSRNLSSIFVEMFGEQQQVASVNFVNSLAGYSILQYLFLIKDRHNGNIMIDSEGHLIHIDFGFLLGSSPGNMGFQTAPFKFPQEYLQIMGGYDSQLFKYFKQLLFVGFTYIRRYAQDILKFIKVTKDIVNIRCLDYYRAQDLERRFMLGMTDAEVKNNINKLINVSLGSSMTLMYDQFQYKSNGIYY